MRPIEFRGKRIDNGQWVYGDLIQTKPDSNGKSVSWIKERTNLGLGANSTPTSAFHEVQPETVGQYTERTDTHGNKVFENDRVKFGDWNEREGIVTTKDGIWIIDDQKGCSYYLYLVRNLRVIGTVHDEEDKMEELLECEYCGKKDESVEHTVDPFKQEINNEILWVNICKDCHTQRSEDV